MSEAQTNGFVRNETVAFERSDVDTRMLLYFVAGLGVSLAGVMVVIWVLFTFLVRSDTRIKQSTYLLAEQVRRSRPSVEDRLPPGPRLEGMGVNTPGGHTIGRMWPSTVVRQAAGESAALDKGGWVETGKLARIPIRDVIAQQAKGGPPPKQGYEQLPSGTSSGRAPNGGARAVTTTALLLLFALGNPPVAEPGAGGLPAAEVPANVADLGFDQRLDVVVPLDLAFRDETGGRVTLRECVATKPTILVLAYYRCPQLCTLVLNGLLDGLQGIRYAPGEDFNVVTVSFDARETPEMAAAKKAAYVGAYPGPRTGEWRFLTGDAPEIAALTQAVGFRFSFDAKNDRYNHASGIVVLTPDGRVSRYLFGIRFAPRDLKLALLDASAGKIGTPVDQLLLFCFQYDHANGRYTFAILNLMRAAGAATVLGLAFWLMRMARRPRPLPSATA